MTRWSWEPPPDLGATVRLQRANGIDFELVEAGVGDRLALCLHGFPELNFSWRHQIPMLVEKGWRVWAPNLRGYGASTRPDGIAAYHLDRLTEDVAALIDAAGAREVMLVAHDWGAVTAWDFAIRRLRPLDRLVIMNVPHPRIAAREMRHWRQLRRSWYIFFFQLPRIPEWALTRNEAFAVRQAFARMAIDKSRFPEDVLDVYAKAALRPGAAQAMVNYYRALVRAGSRPFRNDVVIETPTLMIWGEEDSALNIRCTEGMEGLVTDLTLHRLPGVSHWVQQETPETVNRLIANWLDNAKRAAPKDGPLA